MYTHIYIRALAQLLTRMDKMHSDLVYYLLFTTYSLLLTLYYLPQGTGAVADADGQDAQ